MSVVPYLMRELLHDMDRPALYDQHFGLGFQPAHLASHARQQLRNWRFADPLDTVSHVASDKNNFKVSMDVHQFKPDELTVKVVEDDVVVEGKHEERSDDHGYISRHFKRRYRIPENVDKNALQSNLSSDGVLQLVAPKRAHPHDTERTVPITRTFRPAVDHHPTVDHKPAVHAKAVEQHNGAPSAQNSH